MARVRWKYLICSLLFFVTVIVCGIVPHLVLVEKVERLRSLNDRLHNSIEELKSYKVGVTVATGTAKAVTSYGRLGTTDVDQVSVKASKCETIHVGFVAAGYNASRDVATVIKSILFHRHNPIHFHFVSDAAARLTLGMLLRTWQLPAVKFSFYRAEDLTNNVSWIPTFHYSGVYGLLKLILPDTLPQSLKGIVMLDTDLMVNVDISLLWQFLDVLWNQKKLLGIVENQSNWYLGNLWVGHHPWPALGRGFNTGVVIFNLKAMRRKGWFKMWSTVARNNPLPTALADQDIVNAVIKKYPNIHHVLPCTWNVQLSDNALSEFCYQSAKDFKIIHWNSPRKTHVKNNHGPYFKTLYQMFLEYNGNLLRRELLGCKYEIANQENLEVFDDKRDPCLIFRSAAKVEYRTHLFFLGTKYTSTSDNDITLVSQLSMDRLSMLEPLCHHWAGPMSLSVYASDLETLKLINHHHSSLCLRQRDNIAIHIVYPDGSFYPVNYLRNVAVENAQTQYVFLCDIDFLPYVHLYGYLQEAARVLGTPTRAFIVPAFETHLYNFDFPPNKTSLIKMLESQFLHTFRHHEWPKGHAPTNYDHWITASIPYHVHWEPDFEPYVMVSISKTLPKYDTRFVGFGWNKVSHIMELEMAGYDFVVLPNAFIVHMPHGPSLDISNFRSSSRYRDCLQVLKKEFQDELIRKYKKIT